MYFSICLNHCIEDLKAIAIISYMISYICCLIAFIRAVHCRNGENNYVSQYLAAWHCPTPLPLASASSVICMGNSLVFRQRPKNTIGLSGKTKVAPKKKADGSAFPHHLQRQQNVYRHRWQSLDGHRGERVLSRVPVTTRKGAEMPSSKRPPSLSTSHFYG